jgi:putative endonuclease
VYKSCTNSMVTTYVLHSLKDGKNYTGFSENVFVRLQPHNAGKVAATRHRRPLIILYTRSFESRTEARAFEKYLKTSTGRRFLAKELQPLRGSLPD